MPTIRRFQQNDAEAASALIIHTIRTSNSRDYSPEYIEQDAAKFTPAGVMKRAGRTHFYVACADETIVGCGAIGLYWGKVDESSLFTIFVLPEYQGQGIGRLIIETLEQEEYFLLAKRIEIPASITACGFYRKMGYGYKNGVDAVDEEQLYRLEKFRERGESMANYSICGIDCAACRHRTENGCTGCRAQKGNIFWGTCDLYKCCAEKQHDHCGQCAAFPCEMLRSWAESENPERIENLRKLSAE